MPLFTLPNQNLLPYDGETYYHGLLLNPELANHYFDQLLNKIHWENDRAIFYGKEIITQRKFAWYADQPTQYTYSQVTRSSLPWIPELLMLKKQVEDKLNHSFNSCLCNLYPSGAQGMAYHSDDEKELVKDAPIASISLGAERRFLLKHKKEKTRVTLSLENGSLLVMQGKTQKHWMHSLPKTKKVHHPRINLTFRCMNS